MVLNFKNTAYFKGRGLKHGQKWITDSRGYCCKRSNIRNWAPKLIVYSYHFSISSVMFPFSWRCHVEYYTKSSYRPWLVFLRSLERTLTLRWQFWLCIQIYYSSCRQVLRYCHTTQHGFITWCITRSGEVKCKLNYGLHFTKKWKGLCYFIL